MTDGIIAFNRKGEIILINPAAKKFLSIRPEDNTFDDIFSKFKLDINMEEKIETENLPSLETVFIFFLMDFKAYLIHLSFLVFFATL